MVAMTTTGSNYRLLMIARNKIHDMKSLKSTKLLNFGIVKK